MPGSINGAVRQDIQSINARGMDSSACATERPAFINLVTEGRNDPIALFKQQPHQTANAKELVLHEAQKNLPADFLQKDLSPEGNKIRTLIGVIYKDVQDSDDAGDRAKLDKVCKKLAEANGNENKERKVAKELSGLVSKYGAGAFEKVINKCIEHCMEAWEDHHQAKSVDTHDKAIFKQCLDVCKSTLKHDVEGLTQPDQPWETMAQKLNFFVNDCAAISKTLTNYDAEPVMPAPKSPETLNPNHDGGADNQRVFIPTGPGQGGITLNITSQGGSVGDISHSVGASNTTPVDSNSTIVKHILDSGLTNVEKVGLIKDLFNAGIGGGSNFLGNLAGVQGYKAEQAVDTPQHNVARREIETQTLKPALKSIATQTEGAPDTETVNDASLGPEPKVQQQSTIVVEQNRLKTAVDGEASKKQDAHNLEADNIDSVVLREKKETSGRTSLSSGDYIYTTSRNIDPLNRRSSTPTHFIPPGAETQPERASGKVVTLADKFEALKQRSPSVFAHLDKNGAVASEGKKAKPTAEHDIEKSLPDSQIRPEPELPLNSQVRNDASAANRAPASIKTANPGMDSTDGGMPRKDGEEVSRKSASDGFQPTRINAAAVNMPGNRSGNDHVYTTVRTVNSWNREPKPVSFVPKSDSVELNAVLSRLKPRDQSKFDALENKRIEQDKEPLPFQEKLAEFRRLREQWDTNHE
ncbi:hypothetical protein [Yokenella regensburgei]|uniref:hypothetical protein n=1 Tax=Yokenella regensburgei TaxID=158877 RepID=UPI0002422ADD|nr:hypothetical protein [Yokenella regensburgei]EHM45770.1 hypothetical protein HMPREF0880_03816 [Yokenella regensburgei ATCC 43003]